MSQTTTRRPGTRAIRGVIGVLCLLSVAAVATMSSLGADSTITARPHKTAVIFRFDDFSALSQTDLEEELFTIFERHRVPLTVAVIPFHAAGQKAEAHALPPQKAAMLRHMADAGLMDVALHGYSHVSREGRPTEFAGLSYDQQVRMVHEGREFLEAMLGCHVQTFVPPWNSYDANTLLALKDQDFSCISASMLGEVDATQAIRHLPATCTLEHLDQALSQARTCGDSAPVVVILMHAYDFTDSADKRSYISLRAFDKAMDKLAAERDVEFLTIDQAARSPHALGAAQIESNQSLHKLAKFTPPALASRPLVLRSDLDKSDVRLLAAGAMAYFVAAALGAFWLTRWRLPKLSRRGRFGLAVVAIAVASLAGWFIIDSQKSMPPWIVGTILCPLAGLLAGLIVGGWGAARSPSTILKDSRAGEQLNR